MAAGCEEKLDGEFVRWVLWGGRSKTARQRYQKVQAQYPDKTVVLRDQRQLDAFVRRLGSERAAAANII